MFSEIFFRDNVVPIAICLLILRGLAADSTTADINKAANPVFSLNQQIIFLLDCEEVASF